MSANDSTTSGGTLTYAVASGVSNGTLNFNADGSYTYQGNSNFNGTDSFTYTVTDATAGESATQTVTLTVTQVNDAGTFGGNLSATTNEDTATSGTVTFTDTADGYTGNTFALNTAASNGTATIDAAGNWTYTPNANFNGADAFTVQVTDDDGNVETQVISITVTQVNDAGTFGGNLNASTNQGTATSGTITFTDTADGYTGNTFAINTAASNGSATISSTGNWNYVPSAGFSGNDSFTVQVTDDNGNVQTQMINITINPVIDVVQPTPGSNNNDQPNSLDQEPSDDQYLSLYFDPANLNNVDVITYEDIPITVKVEIDRIINTFIETTDISTDHDLLITQNTIAKAIRYEISNVIYENIAYYFSHITDNNTHDHSDDDLVINQMDSTGTVKKEAPVVNDKVTYKITGTVLSASAIWWAIRATGLLGTLLTSIPAWRQVDLLAILPDESSISNSDNDRKD